MTDQKKILIGGIRKGILKKLKSNPVLQYHLIANFTGELEVVEEIYNDVLREFDSALKLDLDIEKNERLLDSLKIIAICPKEILAEDQKKVLGSLIVELSSRFPKDLLSDIHKNQIIEIKKRIDQDAKI